MQDCSTAQKEERNIPGSFQTTNNLDRRMSLKDLANRTFLPITTGILLITSCIKLVSVFAGSEPLLRTPDPMFSFLKTKQVLCAVGSMELIIAMVLLLSNASRMVKLFLVLCLSTGFLTYRGAYWYHNIESPCKCLGSLTEWLPAASPELISKFMFATSIYLFVGSCAFAFMEWRAQQNNAALKV